MATNGFFGKLKEKIFGVAKAEEKRKAKVTKPKETYCRDGGHKGTKTGAFGGTGTCRGRKGMPGHKLIKKTARAGWKARNRVVLSTKSVGLRNHDRAMRMTERAITGE